MEGFKPFGIPLRDLEPVILFFEEYEAIRLLDHAGMTQAEAAREMAVSRPTLTRIYEKARRTIAEALVLGKAIFIEGGDFHAGEHWYRCNSCYRLIISDREQEVCSYCHSAEIRQLAAKGPGAGTEQLKEEGGFCLCLRCNIRLPHEKDVPCRKRSCPQCGRPMIRENSYHHRLYLKKKGENNENRNSE
jgi:predicted DNA-binding protein (UPF0251 family)